MITFPLKPFAAVSTFTPYVRSITGSPALNGASQVITSGMGLWQARVTNINIRNKENHLLWRNLQTITMGRENAVLVPVCEGNRQPYPASQPGPYEGIPHSDGTFFSDSSGYYGAVIIATVASSIARGTVVASITTTLIGEIQPGHYFSAGDRLYRVKSIESVSVGTTVVKFWPPAREAIPSGTTLDFDRPACKMKLKTDDAMNIDPSLNRLASTTLDFVEDLS